MENKKTVNGMLIGKYVQQSIKRIFEIGRLTNLDISNLQTKDYCKEVFGLNYPMLKGSTESRLDKRNNPRYYVSEKIPGYWFTNDWYERNWDAYLKWESAKLNS